MTGDHNLPNLTGPGTRCTASYAEIKYRRAILDACPIDLYIASYTRTYWWPYRLQHASAADRGIRNIAERGYILDSNVADPDTSNADILDRAADLEASYVIPKDYLGDQQATTASIREFLDQYDDHDCRSKIMIPLQPPYETHYRELSGFDRYALGGIRDRPAADQLSAIRRFREVAGDDAYAHALGMGASLTLVRKLRSNPGLLDSLDLSTPEQLPKGGRIPDENWKQKNHRATRGELSSVVRGLRSAWIATRLAYELSDLPYEEKEPKLVDDEPFESVATQDTLPLAATDGGGEQ